MCSLGFCAVNWFVVSGGPWLHLRSSPGWVVRCWGGLLLVFWCWCVLFFCLVCRVEFLWLLCCGWFVALRSLVGRCCCTVALFSLCVVGCFYCMSCLLRYLFRVHYCELRYFRVTLVCRYPVCACCL